MPGTSLVICYLLLLLSESKYSKKKKKSKEKVLGVLLVALYYKTVITSHQAADNFSWCQTLKQTIELAAARYLGLKRTVAAPRASSVLLRCAMGAAAPSSPAPGRILCLGSNALRLLLLEKEAKTPRAGKGLVRADVQVSAG